MKRNEMHNIEAARMRDYSSLFSYSVWADILQKGSTAGIDTVYHKYDDKRWNGERPSYHDYFKWVYRCLLKNYRNEYVYKNEFVGKYIIRNFGDGSSVAINEFRVGDTVADLALFNGESKCFEIKSDLDNPQRLSRQMTRYQRVFDKCYILIPEEMLFDYRPLVDDAVGIFVLRYSRNGRTRIAMVRDARRNERVDVDILMRTVRANEYRWMVRQAYGNIPDVTDFEMFEACTTRLSRLPSAQLHSLFCEAVKTRRRDIDNFVEVGTIFRQMALCMNLSLEKMTELDRLFNRAIL